MSFAPSPRLRGEVSYTAGFGSPAIAQAARNVFTSRQATVI